MPRRVATIRLTLTRSTIAVGQSLTATAVALDAAGRTIPHAEAPVEFGLGNGSPGRLEPAGEGKVRYVGTAAGVAQIDATASRRTAGATVTITTASPAAPLSEPVPDVPSGGTAGEPLPLPVPVPVPVPPISVGPRTIVVRPGAPVGGDGSEAAPFGSLTELDRVAGAAVAGARVVLRGGALPVGESLVLRGGPGPDLPTIYEVPSGEVLTVYGGVDANGPPAVYGNRARWVARRGVIRIRPDPRVPHAIRRFLLVGCADVDLGVIDVAGTYSAGDATGAGSMGDNALLACERITLPRGGSVDVVGSTPESPSNDGDCLFIGRGCRDVTVTGWTFKRAGHVGTTVIGGELLDGVPAPATERVRFVDCTWENEWTGGAHVNGATRGVTFENSIFRGIGRRKANAMSRGAMLLTGDGTAVRGAVLEDCVYAILVQAYYFRGLFQHARGVTLQDVRGRGVDGPALVQRAKGVDNDPPSAPDFWCELRDLLAEGLDFTDVCRVAGEDYGTFGGRAFPFVQDYWWASDQERAAAHASRWLRAGVVRNSRATVAPIAGRGVGALARLEKQGLGPHQFYATGAEVAAALPGWGVTVG